MIYCSELIACAKCHEQKIYQDTLYEINIMWVSHELFIQRLNGQWLGRLICKCVDSDIERKTKECYLKNTGEHSGQYSLSKV